MAKQGMKHPDEKPDKKDEKKKKEPLVPEIQGKAKNSSEKVNPIIAGPRSNDIMVYHTEPFKDDKNDIPVSDAYPAIDTELAIDNLQNDIPEADLQDI